MRSKGFTFLLILLAAALLALAGIRWSGGDFHAIFGKPATAVGSHLYPELKTDKVTRIEVLSGGTRAIFTKGPQGWMAEEPWKDRVDPRIAGGIIAFTRGMKVEDSAPVDKAAKSMKAAREGGVVITLEDAAGGQLARYLLGQSAPWKAEEKDNPHPIPTVFVRCLESGRKDDLYVATGDITSLFKENLRFLRDHHPFSFHPAALRSISLATAEGAITLGRETPRSPWRIVKPLDLPTHADSVRRLIERLYEFQAVKVSDRGSVTLSAGANPSKGTRISLQSFSSDPETTLEIFPPETADATETLATVSDRPDTVFSLALKPERDLVSVADLSVKLDDLRDPALTRLNIAALRGILIQSRSNPEILVTREPPAPWMATASGRSFPANEENLYRLLKNITGARAISFASDAATDFTPWGLDKPFLTMRFLAADNQSFEIRFGMDGKGGFFANRLGTPTVMRVDELLVRSISSRPYEWMPSRVWTLNRVHLAGIIRDQPGTPRLALKYDFNFESWSGDRGGREISSDIDAARANQLLGTMENLKVARWLASDDEDARAALLRPAFTCTVIERAYDEQSEFTGLQTHVLTLAPAGDPARPTGYYGAVTGSPHPFLITPADFARLTAPVTE